MFRVVASFATMALLLATMLVSGAYAKTLKVGVVQTVIEDTLAKNQAKLLRFIDQAKDAGCQLVVFPENSLYWPDISVDHPTKADLDAAIEQIGRRAQSAGLFVIFGTGYKNSDDGKFNNHGVVFDADGNRVIFYRKNMEVPQRFDVGQVPCSFTICSDRNYLEHSDLPCLVQESQLVVDISGGHGGDDGRPDLRRIRYRPWATRMGAFVIVSNPVHDDTDFMGHSPWGGGSAIISPDGSMRAGRTYEKDVLIVEELDMDQAKRSVAERRRHHPIFKPFWDMGKDLLEKKAIAPAADVKPYTSAVREIKIAAAQMACSAHISENVKRILSQIDEAAKNQADIVVFPELAVTGNRSEDVLAATELTLEDALNKIRNEAKRSSIYVVVGMPRFVAHARRNCALVIGDDGNVKTQYAQITTQRTDLFQPGTSTKAMWFTLDGVHSIVTVGDDANWIEIGDLAANRGMCLHFHISYECDASADDGTLRKQKNLLALRYAQFGAVVNAADPSRLVHPSSPAGGMSMIVSREGGHEQTSPTRVEYYLPYQTSIAKSAQTIECIIYATKTTARKNNLDLDRHWTNRNRRNRQQRGWDDWIKTGATLIDRD